MNDLINESSENLENLFADFEQRILESAKDTKEQVSKLGDGAREMRNKQMANENLTKDLNASLLDLLKDEIEKVKQVLVEQSTELAKLEEAKSDKNELGQNVQILENKLKKLPTKKKVEAKIDLLIESLTKEINQNAVDVREALNEMRNHFNGKIKAKLDSKDLSHFMMTKLDTDTFNSQISVLSESLVGVKNKIGILHQEFRNLPQPQLTESEIIAKLERKIKPKRVDQLENEVARQFQEMREELSQMAKHEAEAKREVEKQLNFKADRQVLQQLLKEQAKINDFICAENIVARFKVRNSFGRRRARVIEVEIRENDRVQVDALGKAGGQHSPGKLPLVPKHGHVVHRERGTVPNQFRLVFA